MEPIVSGTTTERIVRTALLALLFSVFSGMFFHDGLIAYPRENMEVVVKALGVAVPDPSPALSKTIDADSAALASQGDLVRDALAKFDSVYGETRPGFLEGYKALKDSITPWGK